MRILVVDDEEWMLEVCRDTLCRLQGIEIITADVSARAADLLRKEVFDFLILDMKMPGMNGVELLRLARELDEDLPVIMFTAYPTVETAIECMKLGALDYITKPFTPEQLLASVNRLLNEKRLRAENRTLYRQVERTYRFDDLIGKSPAMLEVFDLIQQVSKADAGVLIVGETGTGKELVARSIHRRSLRAKARFVPVDCGAIPENLLESELFGYERGAFTGAVSQNIGILELAKGGTFFLDEVGDLPLMLQAKLLRVIQERKFRRVGGREEIDADVRIVAAANRDLEQDVGERRFREDLYYRLNVFRITLPPLRERQEDISLLASHFAGKYAREMGKSVERIDPEAEEILANYPWRGNVRELQNVLKRAIILTKDAVLSVDDLPDGLVIKAGLKQGGDKAGFFQLRARRIEGFEREYLGNLLKQYDGDVTQAAKTAQVPRGTFYRLMKKYDLRAEDYRS